MAEEQRLRRKCNRYAKRLVLLGEDDIVWEAELTPQNTSSNSEHAKCEHDFEPRKTWVHTCRKCGTVQIEKGHFA